MLSNKPGTPVARGSPDGWTNRMGAGEGVRGFALVPGDPPTETGGGEQYDRATRTRAHG